MQTGCVAIWTTSDERSRPASSLMPSRPSCPPVRSRVWRWTRPRSDGAPGRPQRRNRVDEPGDRVDLDRRVQVARSRGRRRGASHSGAPAGTCRRGDSVEKFLMCVALASCAVPVPLESTDYSELRCEMSSGWKFCSPTNGEAICHAICQASSYCGVCEWHPEPSGKWIGPNGFSSECPQSGDPGDGSSFRYVCQPGDPL